ncbi:UDP-N-acetylglucosamine transferase subunit ALG13-like [Amphiura filiformis]|uniref:UDP-N-acetylglucosamine transferase subunit ALG13-like n=1 Tax=Amphiura filiformis TaxID=82378 RepID=UPI003B21DD12
MSKGKTVFVTVGTTSFDALVETASSKPLCTQFQKLGYTRLLLQIGRGTFEPEAFIKPGFKLEFFRYKDSIAQDIKDADLVISHAGAGSCLETLGAGKAMVVVINELLMGNHQLELANQLHRDGHLFYSTPSTLSDVLSTMDVSSLKPFPPGKPEKFAAFLDKAVGIRT